MGSLYCRRPSVGAATRILPPRQARLPGLDSIGRRTVSQHIWREAARRIEDGGVVYVQVEQRTRGGRPAWIATGVTDGALPAATPAQPE